MKTIKKTKSKCVKNLNLKAKMKKTKPVSKKTSNKKTIRLSHKNRYAPIEAALKELASPTNPSVNSTASRFGIPETTLRRAVEKGLPKRSGPGTVLSKHEEEQLVGYCKNMQKLGFGLTKSGVNHCVMEIVRNDNRSHPFAVKGPGRAWWNRFMKDHLDLSFRMP